MSIMDNDVEAITQILVDHQRIRDRCICGYQYRLGESIVRHRAQVIVGAGFHRSGDGGNDDPP